MALKTFLFIVTNCLCISFSYSKSLPFSNVSFADFVLDGKKDCGLLNHNAAVINLFKIVSCPNKIQSFSDKYFVQRGVLPCFGAYDALYNLCEFDEERIDFNVANNFKDPETFCIEAKRVYEHVPFKYSNDEVKKWANALVSTMTNETLCNNLCVLNNEINEQCIAMVTFVHEYVHLKLPHGSNDKLKTAVESMPLSNATKSKSIIETGVAPNVTGKAIFKASNVTKTMPSESVKPSSNDATSQQKPVSINNTKGYVKVNQNCNIESKALPQLDKGSENVNPVVETQSKTEVNVETENADKAVKTQNPDKNINTIPTSNSDLTKASLNEINEGEAVNDDTDKTVTQIDEMRASVPLDNEETLSAEAKEKGMPAHRPFSASSPFSLLLNVPNSFMRPVKRTRTSHSLYEENEKLNEEYKNQVPDTEQPAAFQAMSPALNPIVGDNFSDSEDSYSFTYIVTTMAALCCVYLLFHYRNKLLALALEGRKGRGSRGRGRPSSANYSKLHSNLEEAIASNVTTPSATHVLY